MKKFLDKKVMDWKFKKAGEGHSLAEEKPQHPTPPPASSSTGTRSAPSQSAAASAALARLDTQGRRGQPSRGVASSYRPPAESSRRASEEAQKKLCSQPQSSKDSGPPEPEIVDVASGNIVVHMICPVCQLSVPNSEIMTHLRVCLEKEAEKEPLSGAVVMIHTLCRDQEKKQLCVDTVTKYLNNIIAHPAEEKYRRIRLNNKTFQERVACVSGALPFLKAVGFHTELLDHQDGKENFLVLSAEKAGAVSDLEVCKELLCCGESLSCKVDRNLQVFKPSFRAAQFTLPDSFFHLTVDEIRKDQKLRSEAIEREGILRTRAMRERDEVKMAMRHYRFVLIRVRMPDGHTLQGVFRPLEKLGDVRTFVYETLVHQTHPFSLSYAGRPFSDETLSLAAFGLVPSAVLNFTWDTNQGPTPDPPFMNSDLLARVQDTF